MIAQDVLFIQFQQCSLLIQILHRNYVSNRVNLLVLLDIWFADVKPVVLSKLDLLKHFHDPMGYYFIEMTYTQSSISLQSYILVAFSPLLRYVVL